VLLIEDDQAVREATSSILETNGFEVLKAAGLTEGLALFEQSGGHIDLVISDVVLSDGSGLELVEQILERIPDTRILLCSGYTDEKSQWPIITAKGYPFIHKPFTMTQLLKKIRETITGATPTE
jgi:DNA-binding NtrC family response regulator